MRKTLQWLGDRVPLALNISLIVLSWSVSIYLVAHSSLAPIKDFGQLATLLFGSASIALFLLSIAIGAFAFFGWQTLERFIQGVIESSTDAKIEVIKNELRGRVYSGLGYLVGEMGLDRKTLETTDMEKLDEAVANCRQGYDLLRKVGGPVEFMGLNNLIYYACAHGNGESRDFMLAQAIALKKAAKEHSGQGSSNALITACGAILKYSIKDEEKNDAQATLEQLLKNPIPDRQKREARLYLSNAHIDTPSATGLGASKRPKT